MSKILETTAEAGASLEPPIWWDTNGLTLMCATDAGYVLPLAASLSSVVANRRKESEEGESKRPLLDDCGSAATIQLVLLDGGITEPQWERFSRMLAEWGIATIRVIASPAAVSHLSVSHHISHTAYFRLLSSTWLPDWISRVIYLDCDTLVVEDVGDLWDLTSQGEKEVWAVPDIACPFIDARVGCGDYKSIGPYLAAVTPVANYGELGIPADQWYFNSGVMVLDLQRWREADRSTCLLRCLQENPKHVWCWDQYALNVVFHDTWGKLPLRWNFGSHVYDYPQGSDGLYRAPLLPEQFSEMQRNPAVIHFTTEIKPWHYYCFHPEKDLYFEYLDRTPWVGQRPDRPGFSTWWHVQTFKFQKRLLATGRRMGL